MGFNSLLAASMALSAFTSTVGATNLLERNSAPSAPPCSYPFTPFVYVGCYTDTSVPRTLPFSTGLNTYNMTVELCVASCKGQSAPVLDHRISLTFQSQWLPLRWSRILRRVLLRRFRQWSCVAPKQLLFRLFGQQDPNLWWK